MTETTITVGVDRLVADAVSAGRTWARTPRAERARVLGAVAEALDAAADRLVPLAQRETHLPEPRLSGELTRTTFQLRLLAAIVTEGGYLDARVDHADPNWPMGAPRPDLRRTAVPLGPVLVFAASNFPFAFSVAGGDTASALAAGCPVVVKAHEGHPQLSVATAEVVTAALAAAGAPAGLFALVSDPGTARAVLTHPDVKAGAFTGSIPGGRTLSDIASSRPEPIPFFGELSSVNPVFVTRSAAAARAEEIVTGFVGSFTVGAGQICTKPGVLLVPEDSDLMDRLSRAPLPEPARLLNERIAAGHGRTREELAGQPGVTVLAAGGPDQADSPAPALLTTTADHLVKEVESLFTECFGPTALVVTYRDEAQLLEIAEAIDGQLTATIVAEPTDEVVSALAEALARKAGRLLWNQWPTGVSVTYAQQHGGPYPATTAPATTSVGTAAIDRFTRPVAWQGFPDLLLPDELREVPSAPVPRRVDGQLHA
ncbi:aldehyde dehydrogenase (NADP(+)) [Kribbella catacumbae]|uniref:aldehyde dehydrogenase (NADP(+)) n=1 Tax=Kribbella catacumbae TaxID=460086 RepID=UPI00037360B1|nr:aldehyde dehydrogenase (NADP(+)) [Kribbella catacumbae]